MSARDPVCRDTSVVLVDADQIGAFEDGGDSLHEHADDARGVKSCADFQHRRPLVAHRLESACHGIELFGVRFFDEVTTATDIHEYRAAAAGVRRQVATVLDDLGGPVQVRQHGRDQWPSVPDLFMATVETSPVWLKASPRAA